MNFFGLSWFYWKDNSEKWQEMGWKRGGMTCSKEPQVGLESWAYAAIVKCLHRWEASSTIWATGSVCSFSLFSHERRRVCLGIKTKQKIDEVSDLLWLKILPQNYIVPLKSHFVLDLLYGLPAKLDVVYWPGACFGVALVSSDIIVDGWYCWFFRGLCCRFIEK